MGHAPACRRAADIAVSGAVGGTGPLVLHFAAGLPGFPAARRFALDDAYDGARGLYALRCLDEDVAFTVALPHRFFPGYEPSLDEHAVARLDLQGGDAMLLVILTVGADAASSTGNLLAPIVVNRRTSAAAQITLGEDESAIRSALRRSPVPGQTAVPGGHGTQ